MRGLGQVGSAAEGAAGLALVPARLLADAACSLASSAESADTAILNALIERLPEIADPDAFDEVSEQLLRRLSVIDQPALAIRLLDQLLFVFDQRDRSELDTMRAGAALQAAVDLIRARIGASGYAIIARLERLGDVPESLAPALVRAVGRIEESRGDGSLVPLLRRLAGGRQGQAPALFELGLSELRSALRDPGSAEEALSIAESLLVRASEHDPGRGEAGLFAAAARAVRALLGGDHDDVGRALAELSARAQQSYEETDSPPSRSERLVGPIGSRAAAPVLASRLRVLHASGEEIRERAIGALRDFYLATAADTILDLHTNERHWASGIADCR